MILLEGPYVSDFLLETIEKNQIPVLQNTMSESFSERFNLPLLDGNDFAEQVKQTQKLYSNSENAVGWMMENLSDTPYPEKIQLLKDKVAFREALQDIYPDFYFKGVMASELPQMDFEQLPTPVILKPAIGFFSLGVYKINSRKDWNNALQDIQTNLDQASAMYPGQVIDNSRFILEQCINGDEFAVDAYFDKDGKPVVLNILQHDFSSDADVSDRWYYTSPEMIRDKLTVFSQFLEQINEKLELKNFPFHLELRTDGTRLAPIEINPMRLCGWCLTDLMWYAYGINPYEYYLEDKQPDWDAILKGKEGNTYNFMILDAPNGPDLNTVKHFDYEKLLQDFSHPLHLRKLDHHSFPIFGFLFLETAADKTEEFQRILHSDLKEYMELEVAKELL
ncbi:MAG: ATP-grasp domain-containing protein [Marinifilaceae bacterium]